MTNTEIKSLLESEEFIFPIINENEEDALNDLRNKVDEVLKPYGLEVNWYDFDYERIYKTGYDNNENWEEYYVTSFTIIHEDDSVKIEVIG